MRDAMMTKQHKRYPHYGFDSNRGYATPDHKRALHELGPCAIHRRLFAPVRIALESRGFAVNVLGRSVDEEPEAAYAE